MSPVYLGGGFSPGTDFGQDANEARDCGGLCFPWYIWVYSQSGVVWLMLRMDFYELSKSMDVQGLSTAELRQDGVTAE
jgi:hypothetical protein